MLPIQHLIPLLWDNVAPAEVKGLSLEAKGLTLKAEVKPNSPSQQRQQW